MKKALTSILVALTLISAMPLYNVNAAENPDLQALANSLGAETDHFNFTNFQRSEDFRPLNWDYFDNFYKTCTNWTAYSGESRYLTSGQTVALGMSILEVLSHNGVIRPSDILPNAQTLSEIDFCKEADKYITLYQMLQEHHEFNSAYRYKLFQWSPEQEVEDLCKIAENNMINNRYFLIFINCKSEENLPVMLASVGIGITDGEWEFNGKKYDKCILTLDPNGVAPDSSPESPIPMPFKESVCIYVNSETNDFICPAYFEKNLSNFKIAAIDDDSILNYKGAINPSNEINEKYSTLNCVLKNGMEYEVEAQKSDGSTQIIPDGYNIKGRYIKGENDNLKIKSTKIYEPEDKSEPLPSEITYVDERGQISMASSKEAVYTIEKNKYTFEGDNNYSFWFFTALNEGFYNYSPRYEWHIQGDVTDNICFEYLDDGILLRSDNEMKNIFFTSFDYKKGESGLPIKWQQNGKYLKFDSRNDVMISLDDNYELYLKIDPDNDGVFDKKVEKGDYNSDGIIDARDATAVLTKYAELSVKEDMLNLGEDLNHDGVIDLYRYGDFNNDNIIDARDATAILTYYSKSSVE